MNTTKSKKSEPSVVVASRTGRMLADPLLGVLLVVALSSVFGALFLVGAEAYGTDFYRYWVGAQAVRLGWCDNIYSEQGRQTIEQRSLAGATNPPDRRTKAAREVHIIDRGRVEMLGTPFVFAVFAAAYTGNYDHDFQFYRVFCLATYVLAILVICRLVRAPLPITLALLAFFAFFFGPFQSEAMLGNVSRLQVGGIALFLWLQSRHGWRPHDLVSGIVLGLTTMFKPNIGVAVVTVLGLWLLAGRRQKVLEVGVGAALGVGVAVAASSALFGSLSCWSQWFGVLPQILESQRTSADGNLGLSRIILETFGADVSYFLLAGFLAVALLVGWRSLRGAAARRRPDSAGPSLRPSLDEAFLGVGIGIAAMWLSMRLAWAHYLLLFIPLAIYGLHSAAADSGNDAGAARVSRWASLAFLTVLSPVGAVVSGGSHADPRLASLAALVIYAATLVEIHWRAKSVS